MRRSWNPGLLVYKPVSRFYKTWKMLQEERAEIRLWEKGNVMCRSRDSKTGHCRFPEEHGSLPFVLLPQVSGISVWQLRYKYINSVWNNVMI